MNSIELKIVALLNNLKKNYNVVEVKTELESEAARMNEIMRLKEIADASGIGLVMKIGGTEAISDMYEAQKVGVTGLIAPMVETAYSMSKYLAAIDKYFPADLRESIHFGVNIETITACENFNEILELDKINLIDTITVGRVDLSGSMNLSRNDINSDKVYKVVEEAFTAARKKNMRTTMGGGIAKEAIPFIKKLVSKKLLDRFETRKIVFTTEINLEKMEDAIIKANIFELLWLESKKRYYSNIATEDASRIEMLMSRIYKL